MGAPIPRQLPRSPTIPPSPQKWSGNRRTWPRLSLRVMRRGSTLRRYPYQLPPYVRRSARPSRQISPLAANPRWATYHTRRKLAPRLRAGVGVRPCTVQSPSCPLPRQRGRGRQHRRSVPTCRPLRSSRIPRLSLGGIAKGATEAVG